MNEAQRLFEVGRTIRTTANGGGFRVWVITGIYPGDERQENVIEIATLDFKPSARGTLLVPERLLEALFLGHGMDVL